MAEISNIEFHFKQITELSLDLSVFPIVDQSQFAIRKELSKSHGEVFTPLHLVDKMIIIAAPSPSKFNMDLCAGRGQFTVRMLRMFYNQYSSFDINDYLTQYHWFNEFNENSCHELIQIFGKNINLAIGPAEQLQSYPEEMDVWNKGMYKWFDVQKKWIKVNSSFNPIEVKDKEKKAVELF